MFSNKILLRINTNKLYLTSLKNFTGKTETGWKFTTPLMKMKSCKPVPPPGDNLLIPGLFLTILRFSFILKYILLKSLISFQYFEFKVKRNIYLYLNFRLDS